MLSTRPGTSTVEEWFSGASLTPPRTSGPPLQYSSPWTRPPKHERSCHSGPDPDSIKWEMNCHWWVIHYFCLFSLPLPVISPAPIVNLLLCTGKKMWLWVKEKFLDRTLCLLFPVGPVYLTQTTSHSRWIVLDLNLLIDSIIIYVFTIRIIS